MQTVNFSGNVDNGDGSGAVNVNIIMVNRANIDLQYNTITDGAGNYTVAVEPGYYDVYLNGSNYGGVINSGVIVESDTVFEAEMIANIPGNPVISGIVFFEGGRSAIDYQVELLSGDGNSILATTTVDQYGNFNFQTCPIGYHLLRISNAGNDPYLVPLPVPEVNVYIRVQMLKEQTVDTQLIAIESKTISAGQPFSSVCRFHQGVGYYFTNGLMTGGVTTYMSTPGLVTLNVYTAASANPLFNYAIYVDLRQNPFYAMPPSANYGFYDATGDEYPLLAFWPYLHAVNYNSSSPDIVKVYISALFSQPDYWPNAPDCPNANN